MVSIRLTADERTLVVEHARAAALGGLSRIRTDSVVRANELLDDQVVGQLGEAALCKYLTGELGKYDATRQARNATPHLGDQGGDLLGLNVDVKTSQMRRSKNPLTYRLLVRPAERTPGTTYVLALVDDAKSSVVHLVGWMEEHELPEYPNKVGSFEGAFVVAAPLLHELPPFKWN